MKEKEIIVDESMELLSFLYQLYSESPKKKVKSLLQNKCVFHNGKLITQFNEHLKPGDKIEIKKSKPQGIILDKRLSIIEENEHYMVVDKPAGLLTIATTKEKENTLYRIVSEYVKTVHPKNKIYIVNRIDKDTSGLVVFAKDKKTKALLQEEWNTLVIEREYLAIVEGKMEEKSGVIHNYLNENKEHIVYVTNNPSKGKEAITEYEVLKVQNDLTWVKLHLKTGRKNQIRVHMQHLGHPIVGDSKYGSTKNLYHRLALHHNRLVLKDPYTHQKVVFESKIPFFLH